MIKYKVIIGVTNLSVFDIANTLDFNQEIELAPYRITAEEELIAHFLVKMLQVTNYTLKVDKEDLNLKTFSLN